MEPRHPKLRSGCRFASNSVDFCETADVAMGVSDKWAPLGVGTPLTKKQCKMGGKEVEEQEQRYVVFI